MNNDGTLNKLKILVHSDKKCQKKIGEFILPVNPESYTENLKNEYDRKRGQGKQGTNPKYKSSPPSEIKLDFVLDGTNTIQGYSVPPDTSGVQDEVELMKQLLYKVNGDISKPNFLKIIWGRKTPFCSVLTSLDINYVLFKPNGEPLRAKVSATFLEYMEAQRASSTQQNVANALTRVQDFQEGSSLPNTVNEIYSDPDLYLQVAQANDLTSIRDIPSNLGLTFPPISIF